MTRILLVGDIHVMDRPPRNCTDSYTDDIIDMLMHVATLEKELNADAVVWAGDIFHHKQPSRTSHATVLKMINVVKAYKNLYIVTGNHDISNDVLKSVHEKQPLGVLLQAGAKELVGWHDQLPIFGVPWQQRWNHEDTPMEALADFKLRGIGMTGMQEYERDLSKALVITHAPIYPPSTRDEQMFDLVPTHGPHGLSAAMGGEGYLYYGHIHEDHGIYVDEGVTYANMGAISRGSLTEYNTNREVKVAMWSDVADSVFPVGFTEVPIPHKPASEVFKMAEAQEKKAEKLNLEGFLSEVGNATLDISSTATIIDHIQKLEVDEAVKKTSIEILEEVSE